MERKARGESDFGMVLLDSVRSKDACLLEDIVKAGVAVDYGGIVVCGGMAIMAITAGCYIR